MHVSISGEEERAGYFTLIVFLLLCVYLSYVQLSKIVKRKIVIVFLPINLNIWCDAQKNCLIETVLLSTDNICFD